MKNKRKISLPLLLFVTLLNGCATPSGSQKRQDSDSFALIEQRINDLMLSAAKHSIQQHSFTRISHCRYEITTQWQDLAKGYYFAKNQQRFSFTHDIRAIEHTPPYAIRYKDGTQHWGEMIDLSFNRMVPSTFSYIKTDNFRHNTRESVSDAFSISGYDSVPRQVMDQLLDAFKQLALLCDAEPDRFKPIEQRVIGRWEIYGLEQADGAMIITPNSAGLVVSGEYRHEGPYTIVPQGNYYRMIITPDNGEAPFELMLDFVNSNYARLLLLDETTDANHFAPIWSEDKSQYNEHEKKLFRQGDLR